MVAREALWHQNVNRFANQFVTRIAEQSFDMRIYEQDPALMIYKHRAARRSFGRQLKKFLRLLPLSDIH